MALRAFSKICRLIQNRGTSLYSKKVELRPVQNIPEDAKSNVSGANQGAFSLKMPEKPATEESKIMQKHLDMHLQPAMLPNYYKSPIDLKSGIFPQPEETPKQYKQFEKSITYRNVKLPLKKPRLANPFPDPLKAMPSDTMSDQEKADQMQAAARVPSDTTAKSSTLAVFSQIRSYSTKSGGKCGKPEKCPKPEKKKDKCKMDEPCEKIQACTPKRDVTCQRKYIFKPCKKQRCPYPSYSESCVTFAYQHPSECRQCPYKATINLQGNHPTFKPKKRKK